MASVRITKDLTQTILRKVNSAFDPQIDLASKTLAADFGDRVYKYVYRKHLVHMNTLPPDFFEQETDFRFTFKHFAKKDMKLAVDFTQAMRIPYNANKYSFNAICDNSKLYDEIEAQQIKLAAVRTERNSVRRTVEMALEKCTTLKKLLEVMPEVTSFIPEVNMREHHRIADPVKRTRKSTEVIKMSTEDRIAIAKTRMFK